MIRPTSMLVLDRSRTHGDQQSTLTGLPAAPRRRVAPLVPTSRLMPRLVEAGQTFAEPHAGSPDLTRFPVSLAEQQLAHEIIAGHDRYMELLEVTGSTARALGVLFIARGEAGAA